MSKAFEGKPVDSYLDGPPRLVPGYEGLLRMVSQLLAERVPSDGTILVLGAGGGLEIGAMAEDHPHWHFAGVDPSQDMLALAETTTEQFSDRVSLHAGYIDSAPSGPFDGATCILTMHFVPEEARLETLSQIRKRLKPGAPFTMAHITFPQSEPERSTWITRHLTYAGTAPENMETSREAISTRLTILSPDDEESALLKAGFSNVTLFYAGLSFRGWIAHAD